MNNKDKVILGLFFLFLLLATGFLFYMRSQGYSCMVNPASFTYNNIHPTPSGACFCPLSDGNALTFDSNSSYIQKNPLAIAKGVGGFSPLG